MHGCRRCSTGDQVEGICDFAKANPALLGRDQAADSPSGDSRKPVTRYWTTRSWVKGVVSDGGVGLTDRKPPWMRKETWVDQQIREAQERGDFDGLAGAGKPIPNLDRPFTAERWAVDWVTRQGGDLRGLLPPLLQLRRERTELLATLDQVPSEAILRETVAEFNRRLLDQYRRPAEGPLIAVGVLDVEETIAAWRLARPVPPPPALPLPPPDRRWWVRRWWVRRSLSRWSRRRRDRDE
jgi:hypothetical protein